MVSEATLRTELTTFVNGGSSAEFLHVVASNTDAGALKVQVLASLADHEAAGEHDDYLRTYLRLLLLAE